MTSDSDDGSRSGEDGGFRWVTDPVPREAAAGETTPSGETHAGVDESDDSESVRVGLGNVTSEPLGGWDAVPDEPPETTEVTDEESTQTADERTVRADGKTRDATLPTPPRAWREDDPTGAAWWRVVTRATQLSVLLLLSWAMAAVAVGPAVVSAPDSVGTWTAVWVGGLAVLTGAVRFIVLPVALYRDATLVRQAEAVAWRPRRWEFLLAGAVFATPTCLYYLYLRGRHVGNPRVPLRASVLRYEGQRVASNWWLAVGVAVVVGTVAGGVATGLSELSAPTTLARTALGGPFLTLAGAEAFVATTTALPRPVDVAVGAPALALGGLAAFLRLAVLPVAFYADATAVRRSDVPWEPLALWYAAAGWVLAVPTGLVYLARRRARTDVSLSPGHEGGSPDRGSESPGHDRTHGGE